MRTEGRDAPRVRGGLLMAVVGAACALSFGPAECQEETRVRGVVWDARADRGVGGALVRVVGTDVRATSDGSGVFLLSGVPTGRLELDVRHERLGEHRVELAVDEEGATLAVTLVLAVEGVTLLVQDPPEGGSGSASRPEGATGAHPPAGPAERGGMVADGQRIGQFAPSSRNLGELLRRLFPSLESRGSAWAAGADPCLEFRGASSRSVGAPSAEAPCGHPQVYLDGVLLVDPSAAFAMTALDGFTWIQAIPPAEAAGRYAGAGRGVIVLATGGAPPPGEASAPRASPGASGSRFLVPSRGGRFDWAEDPNGHPFLRALAAAAVGNAVGLASGLAAGRHCVYVEDGTRELDTSCGAPELAGAGLLAVTLPALGSAIGARVGGATPRSRGSLGPALVGAGMAIVPGYLFSLSTVGGGVEATNGIGYAFLAVGTPLFTTLADRLYRTLRAR